MVAAWFNPVFMNIDEIYQAEEFDVPYLSYAWVLPVG